MINVLIDEILRPFDEIKVVFIFFIFPIFTVKDIFRESLASCRTSIFEFSQYAKFKVTFLRILMSKEGKSK
jgi:hypothetical protein